MGRPPDGENKPENLPSFFVVHRAAGKGIGEESMMYAEFVVL
jgi:hypothetical protein